MQHSQQTHAVHYIDSPLGSLTIEATSEAIIALHFGSFETLKAAPSPLTQHCAEQLREYFDGTRRDFTLPLAPRGTAFQRSVWQQLQTIAYGETWSYAQLACALSNPKAVRAVGSANARNPLPILIPCHRVINHSGKLGGYLGGLEAKAFLLTLERHRES